MARVHRRHTEAARAEHRRTLDARLLTCPISQELLVDPITTPCCGHTVSRACLRDVLIPHTGAHCPLCHKDVDRLHPSFDLEGAPADRTVTAVLEARSSRASSSDDDEWIVVADEDDAGAVG